MDLIGQSKLENISKGDARAWRQIQSWVQRVESAQWENSHRMKDDFPRASVVRGGNTVFDILGNRYRIWVRIDYDLGTVVIKNAGTHAEYEGWDIQ